METSGQVEDIIDAHCHVASSDFTPLAFIEGVVDNSLATLSAQGLEVERQKLLDLYLARMNDPHCDQLVAEMAEANIKQAIHHSRSKKCSNAITRSWKSDRKLFSFLPELILAGVQMGSVYSSVRSRATAFTA
jgi:hypothetical protein